MPLISLFSWLFTIRLFSLYCIFYYFFTTLVFHTTQNFCNKLDNCWRLPPLTVVFALLLIIEMFSIRLSEAKENRIDASKETQREPTYKLGGLISRGAYN